jgi:hypothetical protein
VFSVIWGICFSLKANPNGMKTSDSGTVLAQGTRLLRADACKATDSHPPILLSILVSNAFNKLGNLLFAQS